MYLQNKYTDCYYRIIKQAQLRIPLKNCYYEKHHIIPKSLGGSNSLENLVNLTSKEHFICHLLLVKMLEGAKKRKMVYAYWRMVNTKNIKNRYTVSSRIYESAKIERSNIITSLETKEKMRLAALNRTEEHKQNLSKSRLGRQFSDNHKQKLKDSASGKKFSEEHKLKMSIAKKGRKLTDEHKANIKLAALKRKTAQKMPI